MNNQIENAIKVGRAYWFIDGFTEMLGGGLFVLLGCAVFVGGLPPQGSFWAGFAGLVGQVALIKLFGLLAAGLALWWLKDRFTYPRSGFVRGKRVSLAQMLTFLRNGFLCLGLPVLVLAAALAWLPFTSPLLFSLPGWSPVLIGLLWAALCLLAGNWLGLRRFSLLGGLILLAGLMIGALQFAAGLPDPSTSLDASLSRAFISLGLLTLLTGKFFLLSGLVIFLRYRRQNPAPSQEAV